MSKKKFLLVDDNNIFNFISRRTLDLMGIAEHIHVAMNGQQALELFNNYFDGSLAMPDYIFVDLKMPLMDGFEFIQVFNTLAHPEKEKIKIVVVSSSFNPKDVERVKSLGVNHFISKPITEEKIKAIVN